MARSGAGTSKTLKQGSPLPAKRGRKTAKVPSKTRKTHMVTSPTSRVTDILHTMHTLLSSRAIGSTICPSEIPRRLHASNAARYPDWRSMMEEVRDEVWKAVERGEVEVTQRGEVRTIAEREGIKGPIRVRRGRRWKD